MKTLYRKQLGKKTEIVFKESDKYIYFYCLKNKTIRIVGDKINNKKINACEYCDDCDLKFIVKNYCDNDGFDNFEDILEDKEKKKKQKKKREIKFEELKKLLDDIPKDRKIKVDDSFFSKNVNKEIWKNKYSFIKTLKLYAEKNDFVSVESKKRKGTFFEVRS